MKNLILSVAAMALLLGCSSGGGGELSATDQKAANRLDQIAKQSGGDWDKVSADNRQYVINEISHGSEESAKRLVQMKGHPPTGKPGAPQTPGQ